jgi:hypothetical protein
MKTENLRPRMNMHSIKRRRIKRQVLSSHLYDKAIIGNSFFR